MWLSSVDREKLDKFHYQFLAKTLSELEIKLNILNLKKSMYEKPTAEIIYNIEKLNAFLKSEGKNICFHHLYLAFYEMC